MSIEDEDSDFVEEEGGNFFVVKLRVGLSKILIEYLRIKRSLFRENRRKRRCFYLSERVRILGRLYYYRFLLRERLWDYRFFGRYNVGDRKRLFFLLLRERRYWGSYSRGERSRSRDRIRSRFDSVVIKNRENRRYYSRSRSRFRLRFRIRNFRIGFKLKL